ncbi:hypothetical protein [Cysteiniphilum marinum]|uniref:hypothetical protein n=1 Tax=Cysteiniphilum marinum TaxID=2774191 RepID=UPI00193B0175|nr:hypothetical protein [Cysteiniphilum marinum]
MSNYNNNFNTLRYHISNTQNAIQSIQKNNLKHLHNDDFQQSCLVANTLLSQININAISYISDQDTKQKAPHLSTPLSQNNDTFMLLKRDKRKDDDSQSQGAKELVPKLNAHLMHQYINKAKKTVLSIKDTIKEEAIHALICLCTEISKIVVFTQQTYLLRFFANIFRAFHQLFQPNANQHAILSKSTAKELARATYLVQKNNRTIEQNKQLVSKDTIKNILLKALLNDQAFLTQIKSYTDCTDDQQIIDYVRHVVLNQVINDGDFLRQARLLGGLLNDNYLCRLTTTTIAA